MTSGTLAYSFGLGKAVVSTPYWHARELLADGHGILVPFGDATAIGSEIAGLLTGDARRLAMRERAYASMRKGQPMAPRLPFLSPLRQAEASIPLAIPILAPT